MIEEMLRINSDEILSKLESVLKLSKPGKNKVSASRFTGIIDKKDTSLITKAIEEGCEQVNTDDWK